MDENIKNLRDAQQQQKSSQNQDPTRQEENEVDVDVATQQTVQEEEGTDIFQGREDNISGSVQEGLLDPMASEQLQDEIVELQAPQKKKKPLKKLVDLSKKLHLRFGREAFQEDDPAAYTGLIREVRSMVTNDFSEAEIDMLHRFRTELKRLWKRAKKSESDTELSPFEIIALDKVMSKIIDVQETLLESDLPFVLDDIGDVDQGEGDLTQIEDLEEDIISPSDQEQLLDDDIYLVEIEEEEADDYTRWTEPVLQIIAVRDPKKVEKI